MLAQSSRFAGQRPALLSQCIPLLKQSFLRPPQFRYETLVGSKLCQQGSDVDIVARRQGGGNVAQSLQLGEHDGESIVAFSQLRVGIDKRGFLCLEGGLCLCGFAVNASEFGVDLRRELGMPPGQGIEACQPVSLAIDPIINAQDDAFQLLDALLGTRGRVGQVSERSIQLNAEVEAARQR